MENFKRTSSKILSFLLCFTLLANMFLSMPITVDAAQSKPITVIAGSDYQERPSDGKYMYDACNELMSSAKKQGLDPYGMLFCGDYSGGFDVNRTEKSISEIKGMLNTHFGGVEHTVFSQGNHDPAASPSLSRSGNHDTPYYGVFNINDDDYGWYNGDPSNMSDGMSGHLPTIQKTAANLKSYLDQKILEGYQKPIFITSHIPLHYSFRTRAYNDGQYAMHIVEVLNNAGAAGLNIIYLFGHNHSGRSDDYIGGGSIYLTRGDVMYVSKIGDTKQLPYDVPLRFTYMNAGYIAYCANGNPGGNALNLAVFEIRDTEVTVKRCGANGFLPVGAKAGWWTGEESAATYGTTDKYLKQPTGTTMILKPGYGEGNRVDTTVSRYAPVTSFTAGRKYVITDKNTAGSANALKYAAGDASLTPITIKSDAIGAYLENVTSDIEWTWGNVSGSYGTLQGSGGRYLQINGGSGGTIRTSSDYKQTENGTRYSMWRLSSTASSGLYAYVLDADYTNAALRSYIRKTSAGALTSVMQNDLSSSTSPFYAFERQDITSSTVNVALEGIRSYVFKPGKYSSWAELEKVIKAGLLVTVEGAYGTTTTSDYVINGTFDPTKSGSAVITVYYQGEPIGAVTIITSAKTYPDAKTVGDVNGDNKINGKDLIRLKKYALDSGSASIVYEASDVTGDGAINIHDMPALFNKIASSK